MSVADRAIREMNRKEKDIVRAYFRAVKYASQIESRVRIMLIGDEDSGNLHVPLHSSIFHLSVNFLCIIVITLSTSYTSRSREKRQYRY